MKELTVYKNMISGTDMFCSVIKSECGIKPCVAFAVKAGEALSKLDIKTESEAKIAANTFISNLQTLVQGGIKTEDYDLIDFVQRGKVVTLSVRVQGLIRAAKRKGFTIIDKFVAVPVGSDIYFEEQFINNQIVYLYHDDRKITDREITAERLVNKYFERFILRLDITNNATHSRIMTATELYLGELMNIQSASDNGLFFSQWRTCKDENGNVIYKDTSGRYPKREKIVLDGCDGRALKYNEGSIWNVWTGEMVKKSIMRRALKNLKEALPELDDIIMAFDGESTVVTDIDLEPTTIKTVNAMITAANIDITNLTEEQKADVDDLIEIYLANPSAAKNDAEKIDSLYKSGMTPQDIINDYYAEITALMRSKSLRAIVTPIVEAAK